MNAFDIIDELYGKRGFIQVLNKQGDPITDKITSMSVVNWNLEKVYVVRCCGAELEINAGDNKIKIDLHDPNSIEKLEEALNG